MRLNNTLLNNEEITGDIRKEIKRFLETNDNENMTTQNLSVQFSRSVVSDSLWPHESQYARPPCPSQTPGVYLNTCPYIEFSKSSSKSEVYSNTILPQGTRKVSNRQPNSTSKAAAKRRRRTTTTKKKKKTQS